MISETTLETILAKLPTRTIGVFGDLFLDRYLDIEARLDEPSIETGLTAYQVTKVRSMPGATGTVINNLAALGVGKIKVFSMRGKDGEGFELAEALGKMPAVDCSSVQVVENRRTPTYTKPIYHEPSGAFRELNRLDIKNHEPLNADVEAALERDLQQNLEKLDALIVLDQVSQIDCGVVTGRLIRFLKELQKKRPQLLILGDSRTRIGAFHGVSIKPNRSELSQWVALSGKESPQEILGKVAELSAKQNQGIICTLSEDGIVAAMPDGQTAHEPALPVTGPIDVVGAGDSVSAALSAALAAGATLQDALALGMLVASVTIRQLGTTGTAPPKLLKAALKAI